VGDALWVSGSLGGAALALQCAQGAVHLNAEQQTAVNLCLHTPEPRVALGLALRGIASAAIDLSDGLCGDLGHVLAQSGVGATINYANLPRHPVFHDLQHPALEQQCVLAGGDDYELLFTAPSHAQRTIEQLAATHQIPLTHIGMMTSADAGLVVHDAQGQRLQVPRSFDHFA
jgi:thiamine-monophosphate kinase